LFKAEIKGRTVGMITALKARSFMALTRPTHFNRGQTVAKCLRPTPKPAGQRRRRCRKQLLTAEAKTEVKSKTISDNDVVDLSPSSFMALTRPKDKTEPRPRPHA